MLRKLSVTIAGSITRTFALMVSWPRHSVLHQIVNILKKVFVCHRWYNGNLSEKLCHRPKYRIGWQETWNRSVVFEFIWMRAQLPEGHGTDIDFVASHLHTPEPEEFQTTLRMNVVSLKLRIRPFIQFAYYVEYIPYKNVRGGLYDIWIDTWDCWILWIPLYESEISWLIGIAQIGRYRLKQVWLFHHNFLDF